MVTSTAMLLPYLLASQAGTVALPQLDLPLTRAKALTATRLSQPGSVNWLLISEDGHGAFYPALHSVDSRNGDTAYFDLKTGEFQSRSFVQYNKAPIPLILTQNQHDMLFDFDEAKARQMGVETVTHAIVRLLASPKAGELMLGHHNTQSQGDPVPVPLGGISLTSPLDANFHSPKLFHHLPTAWTAVKDIRRLTFVSMKVRGANTWQFTPRDQKTQSFVLPKAFIPRHMGIDNDIIVATEEADYPRRVALWSVRKSKQVALLSLPKALPQQSVLQMTALLPNGDVLACYSTRSEIASNPRRYANTLWLTNSKTKTWKAVGPYRLGGSSNSGKILIVVGPDESNQPYMIWPK